MQGFWEGFEKRARELTTEARNKIPEGQFAIPEERKYPIEDRAHARNAMARVSQFGTSSEKARVHSAVHSKYPTMGE